MTPDDKEELRKVAEKPPDGPIYRTIGADLAVMVKCKHVLALLDENARLAAEVERLPKWIPCSERMPKPNRAVLIFGNDWPSPVVSKLIVDSLDGTPTCFSDSDGAAEIFYLDDVTHWMPLPEPPK